MSQLDKIINILEEDEIALWKKKELPKEGILFKEGEECAQVGIVVEGQLVISSYSYGGKEIVYSLIGPGAMFGNNLLYADDKRYKGNVVAKKRTTLYLIHKTSLMKLLAKNPKFLEFFLSTASSFMKCTKHCSYTYRSPAARAHSVAGCEPLGFAHYFF